MEFSKWRGDFQVGLIEAVASDTGKTAKQENDRMKQEKHQHVNKNNFKCITQKNLRDPILRATATNDSGEIFECKNEEEMTEYMVKSNHSQQQQNIETPYMTKPLGDIFRYLAKEKVAQSVFNGNYKPPYNTPNFVKEFLKTLEMLEKIRKLGPVDLSTSCEKNWTGWGK